MFERKVISCEGKFKSDAPYGKRSLDEIERGYVELLSNHNLKYNERQEVVEALRRLRASRIPIR